MCIQVIVQTHVTGVFVSVFCRKNQQRSEGRYAWLAIHSDTVKTSRASQIKPNVNNWVMPKGSLKKKIPKSKVMEGLMYWKKPSTFNGRRFAP